MIWQPIETAPKDGASVLCWHHIWGMPKYAFLDHCGWKLTETMFAVGIDPTHWIAIPRTPINDCEACGGMGRIMFTADEDIDCLRCHNIPLWAG